MTEPASTPTPSAAKPDSESAAKPWYRRRVVVTSAALVVALVAAIALSSGSSEDVVAAPAPAVPVHTAAEQAFLNDLIQWDPRYGVDKPDRAESALETARTNCAYLQGIGNGSTMSVAQAHAQSGFTVVEGLMFANFAVKHLCPGADQTRVTYQAVAPAAAAPALPPGSFTDGTYLVGSDMPAGNYVTDGTGSDAASKSCYWSRNKNDGGSAGDIIKNNYASGPGRLTAKGGEVVTLQHGCTWVKK